MGVAIAYMKQLEYVLLVRETLLYVEIKLIVKPILTHFL